MPVNSPTRRAMMAGLAALPFGEPAAAPGAKARTLVAYFSRSGNTRVLAGVIERTRHAGLFEIRPAQAYPADYFETVEQARQERDRGDLPPLSGQPASLDACDTVYLGFPVWGETVPPAVRTFLSQHDWQGKTIIPFITHGGYGPGDCQAQLARRAPGATIRPAFVLEADQERRTTTSVITWLKTID